MATFPLWGEAQPLLAFPVKKMFESLAIFVGGNDVLGNSSFFLPVGDNFFRFLTCILPPPFQKNVKVATPFSLSLSHFHVVLRVPAKRGRTRVWTQDWIVL